jgi:hypothetical protein
MIPNSNRNFKKFLVASESRRVVSQKTPTRSSTAPAQGFRPKPAELALLLQFQYTGVLSEKESCLGDIGLSAVV